MDIKQMMYFKTIVEEGTISKAAQVLHMAQPPLSTQLKQLEDELGVQLLKRGHRKVELTQAGKLFYKRSLQILTLSEMTLHEMKETQNEIIRIGITSSNSGLIEKIQEYLIRNKLLSFRIHEGTTYEMIDLLLAHNIDVGLVRTPFDQSHVLTKHYKSEPMVAIGHSSYLNENMQYIKDYQHLPLIIHQRYLSLITDYCLNQHFNPFIKMTSDDCRTSITWASYGLGIAIIPQSALSLVDNQSLVSVSLLDEELYTDIVFITRKQDEIDQKTQDFIEQFFHS